MTDFDFLLKAYPLDALQIVIRLMAAVVVGGLIGNERARHGRAAGMRTHILVCLGAAMTALASLYVVEVLELAGDLFRIPAQVISGVGFLGAGMIILKDNNRISGLTTAAGVWTTAAIGVALGYGFYFGAGLAAVLFLVAIVVFARFEKRNKRTEVIYAELDALSATNGFLDAVKEHFGTHCLCQVVAPKSGHDGNIGIDIITEYRHALKVEDVLALDHVVYAVEEKE